jgi:hypothetical protein
MFAVQSSSLCARSQTTTLRTNRAQKKIQRCQAVRVVVFVLSSSFCEEKNARKTRSLSLSLFLGRSSNLCFGLFFPSVFLPLHSFARGYLPALSFLSLSLSDYHRSKSTRSLSKRWCVLFSMIRFCFFLLSCSRFCPYLSVKSVCASERAFSFNRACFLDDRADFLSLISLFFSFSFSRAHEKLTRYFLFSLSVLAFHTSRNLSRKKP